MRLRDYAEGFKRTNSFHKDPHDLLESDRQLSSLDSLVVSTSSNVSRRLCETAGRIVNQMQTMVTEGDEDMLAKLENLGYQLDDTELSMKESKRSRTSEELAG